ncbi:uncharacterized protein si:dkey-175m17.7 [Syngnathoides biaculeatus]|uniref:uncharacterized protein si:dkey-175m17.7 n=1 Tax=Syngnathoides biaculeatus TaxID=300417 RepID=UPI002ADD63BB|nr:uncharacterized protein si:dkey-175m17.7 [Syngnathoides biaculeatus]
MPPLPLDERIVVIQRPKNPASREAVPHHPSQRSASSRGQISRAPRPHVSQPPSESLTLECKRRGSRPQKTPADASLPPPSHRHSNGTATLGPRLSSHTHTIDIRLTLDKGRAGISSSLGRSGSAEDARGKCAPPPLHQGERRTGAAEPPGGSQREAQRQGQRFPSDFAPAQVPRCDLRDVNERERATFWSRADPQFPLLDPEHPTSGLPYRVRVRVPRAAILNSNHLPSAPAPAPGVSFLQSEQPLASRHRDPGPPILLSSSRTPRAGGFPSPDHSCTVDCGRPFGCGCWRSGRCGGSKGRASSSSSASFSRVHNVGAVKKGGKEMGLRNLGWCLSTASTSTDSTVSEHRSSLFKPLRCASCASEAGRFESPAILGERALGGCLPCAPTSSSGPLRAIHSCVTACHPKGSRAGSSSCSYCSSDPIVVTFNPRRGKAPAGSIGAPPSTPAQDDDYGVRAIWPEELAQENHCAGIGMGAMRTGSESKKNQLLRLDCETLRDHAEHAGRRGLRRDETGGRSGPGYDEQRRSLRRPPHDADGDGRASERKPQVPYPRPPPPASPSPPPPSAPGTLVKPKPRQREREGGHSLPSARSLHLALNSLDREQREEKSRTHLTLPLSSSLPASLADESATTPDAENAAVSAVLPFLFLGNERDAQDGDLLLRLNVGYVVNVTTHLPLYHLKSGLHYKRLPATDSSKQNLRQYFEEVFEFIEEAYQSGRGVLVHCQAGVSRSATIVIAYLMKHTLMTMTDAYKYVRSRRPVVSPNLNFMGQLLEFERDLNSGVTPRILMPKLDGVETQVSSTSSMPCPPPPAPSSMWQRFCAGRGLDNPLLCRESRMKGDTPVNSTMSVGQARKLVEQLKIEASFCRIKVSKAAADLMAYCDAHTCDDPLISPVPTSENPFREKKFFCALL